MPDKLIPFCKLYENTSKTTGKRYFIGNLSFTAKVLLFQNDDAKDGEPGWTLFIAEREPKRDESGDRRLPPQPKPEAGDYGGLAGSDSPPHGKAA